MTFEARYPGHCHACDTRITVGETVTYTEDDELIHHVCLTGERDEELEVSGE